MSKDLNKVFIIGRLGQDPEVRYTGSGTAVVNITVATSEKWKGKDGQLQEHTEWHRVVLWDKLGEIVSQYCTKGSKVHVEGALRTRKWQDQSGNDRYSTEIRATDVIMLDSQGDRPAQTERPSTQPKPQEPSQDDGFDDIPFS